MSDIQFRLTLADPLPGIDYALQKGSGHHYECVQLQRSGSGDLIFEFTATLKPGPDLGGPFVQGPKGARFVYLDLGTAAGQHGSEWSRRLKIPLTLPSALAQPGATLVTTVPGRGKDGTPSCATVKPFAGWQPA